MNGVCRLGLVFGLGVAALTVAGSGTAHAQREARINGQKLVDLCQAKNQMAVEACTAYIEGISDGIAFYQRLRPADGSKGAALSNYVCVPGPTTGAQLRETVVAWFKKHPERANQQASGIVMNALNDTYLCAGEKPRGEAPKPDAPKADAPKPDAPK